VSRFDNIGLWWEDLPAERSRSVQTVRAVDVPDTEWLPPKEFPNLSGVKVLGIDVETKDLELLERGPGAVRGRLT
jgi:hypothetical protein